jgi:invasin B
MAMFIQMVGDNAETNLENELEVNRALQASRQQEMEQKSAEYEEQVRKAEETQKVMGCIAKIIMPVLTVIGVVGAAFSGGASLALAGIGLALMAADAATDGAVTSAIMNPIMEHVFTPLMEFLGDVVKKVLELPVISDLLALLDKATGVDVTGIVTMAVTVLATVAVMVAAMYLTKSAGNAAAKMMGPLVKLIGDQIKKMIPALLKNVSKKSVSTLSKANTQLIEKVGLKSDALSAQRYANNISSAQTGVAATHTGVQAVGTIIQGEAYQKATDALADFKMAKADIERLNNWLTQSVERWSDSLSTTNQMVTKMSNMQQQQQATGIFILNHTHA